MATRQLWIISLVLCSAFSSSTAVNWKLTGPDRLQAYRHDCVIINCTFQYEECDGSSTPERGIWLKKNRPEEMEVIFYHPDSSMIDPAFRGRTELLGNVGNKNCTLKINKLRETDSGEYIFRVEGKTTKDGICHYTYKEQPVALKVDSKDERPVITMEEVKVGSLAMVTCSINYSCPSNPPALNWSHEQRGNYSSVQSRHGDIWRLTSTLTFLTQDSDLDTVINCTAKYENQSSSDYEEKRESTLLKLGYPPSIKEESACSNTRCVCVVDSRPPSDIKWLLPDGKSVIRRTSAEKYKGEYELDVSGVEVGLVYCEASNRYGKATVSFSFGVPVLYIVISVCTVLTIILLSAILFMCRYRRQQAKKNTLCLVPNPLYKTHTGESQNPIKHDAPRRPAPAVPEMCTEKEDDDDDDDDYIIPVPERESPAQVKLPAKHVDENYIVPLGEDEGAHSYASRRSQSTKRKSKRQSAAMRLANSYYIPEEEVPRVEGVDEGIYNNVECNVYANN